MLVESFNRTRWLDKLRPAGASQKADGPEGPMAPIVTTGILVVENLLTRHPCARGMSIFQYRSTGDPQFVRVILAPEPCNFHCIVIKKLQKRVAPIVLLCRIEKTCHIFPPIPTFSNYACHPCTGVMPSASNP